MNNIIIYISCFLCITSFFTAIFLWFKWDIKKAIVDVLFFAPKIKGKRIKVEGDKTVPLFNNTLEENNETSLLVEEEQATVLLRNEESEMISDRLIVLEEIKLIG